MRKTLFVTFVLAALLLSGCTQNNKVQRYGSVIGIKKEAIPEYKKLHAQVWPKVLDQISKSNIRNYSIFLGEIKPDEYYLFGYFEYIGDDFDADMAKMAEDPTTQKWWDVTEPLQKPLDTRDPGEWWHNMEQVFYFDGR